MILHHSVIDMGNANVKIGFFQHDLLQHTYCVPHNSFGPELLGQWFQDKKMKHVLISSKNQQGKSRLTEVLAQYPLSFSCVDPSQITMQLDVQEPHTVGQDRIANAYGALKYFPTHDCIIVDIGTAVQLDFVLKEGRYLGGMLYPGLDLNAQALADYTGELPLTTVAKPQSPLGKTPLTHLQSGIYYGLLGAIERLIAELRMTAPSPSSVKVVATGGATAEQDPSTCSARIAFVEDLKELVDFIHPHLTLVGLHEIQKETIP